jgi:hypothetical protein
VTVLSAELKLALNVSGVLLIYAMLLPPPLSCQLASPQFALPEAFQFRVPVHCALTVDVVAKTISPAAQARQSPAKPGKARADFNIFFPTDQSVDFHEYSFHSEKQNPPMVAACK